MVGPDSDQAKYLMKYGFEKFYEKFDESNDKYHYIKERVTNVLFRNFFVATVSVTLTGLLIVASQMYMRLVQNKPLWILKYYLPIIDPFSSGGYWINFIWHLQLTYVAFCTAIAPLVLWLLILNGIMTAIGIIEHDLQELTRTRVSPDIAKQEMTKILKKIQDVDMYTE